jgi:3-hydroxybutyryl-CoA dehydrogenase
MKVAIVGAGLMGHAIAQVFAHHGHDVRIYDNRPEALATVPERVRTNLGRMGVSAEAAEAVVARIRPAQTIAACVGDADYVTEAVHEELHLKQEVFAEIERHAPPEAVVATNTSVMRISEIVVGCASRHRMLGTHWWNPPHLIPLVEVVPTEWTRPEVVDRVVATLAELGKKPLRVKKDVPGFVANRLQHALWREAFALIDEGICDPETVDAAIRYSFALRLPVLGPIANAELGGLDLTESIHAYIFPHLSNAREPARVIREAVREGRLGMKTKQGLLAWDEARMAAVRERLDRHILTMLSLID